MLSPEERRLIVCILALLLFGAIVDSCRSRVVMRETGKTMLPSVAPAKPGLIRE
jgi:hypothetical protein